MAPVLWHASGSSYASHAALVFLLLLLPRATTGMYIRSCSCVSICMYSSLNFKRNKRKGDFFMKSREFYAGYNVGWLYIYALNMGSRDSGGYE